MTDLVLKWIGFKQICLQQVRSTAFDFSLLAELIADLPSIYRRASPPLLELESLLLA